MYNPKSLLDAYHVAKWQESMNDIIRKNSSTSLSSSSKIDHSKAEKEVNVELEFHSDGKEHVEGIRMKSKGSNELDDKNMDKVSLDSSKDTDTGEAFLNDIKIDSKGWVDYDSSCDESELESIMSCKVDVEGVVNCEGDRKDHEFGSTEVVDNNIDLKNLVEVSKEGDKDEEMSSKDLSRVVDNNTCYVEMTTKVANIRVSVTNVQYDKAYHLLEIQDNKEDDGVKCNEEVRNLVNGVPGMEIDSGRSGNSNSDAMEFDDVMINLDKEDAKRDSQKEVKNRKEYDGEQEENKKRRSLSILVSLGESHGGAKGSEMNKSNMRPLDDEFDMCTL
ncbi:hypothetical protein Tco_0300282, partial [Tanacetum coccineum]